MEALHCTQGHSKWRQSCTKCWVLCLWLACECLHSECSRSQQSVHAETPSTRGPGCQGAPGLCSRSAQARVWASSRHKHLQQRQKGRRASKLQLTYAPTVPVSARRDCISTPGGSALYSQPRMSRGAKTPSCHVSSSLLPTNPKQNAGLYRLCCNVCAI